ncbi:VOC family protein [Litorilituus lipolyticus]|uniref:VOC family protein n=1 Tax=Litorilituus lipolyticus TaxID=2491017 RepID=A0A502KYT4_9GAMM|nr:VOC family protein [Litorilituus lipolyticus]TPH15659.1 VOC family protein [Litorilituus lipolyticus]
MNMNQITLPVTDINKANHFYLTLGFIQIVDTPHYARFACPNGEATFSLSLTEQVNAHDVVMYFEHEHLDNWVKQCQQRGIEFEQLPTDQRYLWREASLSDPSGNKIKLYWAGDNRLNPPWRVHKTYE